MKKVSISGYKMVYRKSSKWNEKGLNWYMECKICKSMTKIGNSNVFSIICYKCVQKNLSKNDENSIKYS